MTLYSVKSYNHFTQIGGFMSSVRFRNNAIAYTKGVKQGQKSRFGKPPYGSTKREMYEWFWRGFEDARAGTVDDNMVIHD